MTERKQFNVNLDADLVRRVKHHAVDVQMSLGDLLSHVMEEYFRGHLDAPAEAPVSVALQPMVHVEDMASSVAFYEARGAEMVQGSRDGDFALLRLGSGELSLLAHPPNPEQDEVQVELNFVTSGDLEALEKRLRAKNVAVAAPASDEAFGGQLQLRTPDGLLVKVNRLEPDLYT